MKKYHWFITAGALLATLSLAGVPKTASAQQVKQARILIHSASVPKSSKGFIISKQGTHPKDSTVRELQSGQYEVSFPYSRQDATGEAVATAMIISEDGSIVYGSTIPLRSGKGLLNSPLLELPACAEVTETKLPMDSQYTLLQSLIDIREKRRKYYRSVISKALSGRLLDKMQILENKLGLQINQPPLNPDMSPMILNDRLGRLLRAIETLRTKANLRQHAS